MRALFARPERRDLTTEAVWGPDYNEPIGTATAVPAVYGSVRLIGDEWSQATPVVSELKSGEYEPIPLPPIIEDPDPFLSPFEWKFTLVAALKLRGNAFGLVDTGRRFCRWLPAGWVQVDESDPLNPRYTINGKTIDLVKRGGSLIHVREFLQPGSVKGLSPISHFAQTFDTSALARQYGRRWFRNSAMPPAILQAKTSKPSDRLIEARDDFVAAALEGKPVALPGEWAYQKVTISPDEAQFLATIQATANEVAVIMGVPPEKVGGRAGSSRSYSNVEMDQELFEIETLGGVSARAASALAPLLRPRQRLAFDLSVLKQPGLLERHRATTEQLRNGTLTLSEARRDHGRRALTEAEIEQWQQWFATVKSESESLAHSVAESIKKEG